MNNTCPTCGALYNVASKDVGRKLKCKKCSSSLRVTDAGLELDTGGKTDEPEPAVEREDDRDERDDREEDRPKKKKRQDREPGPGIDMQAIVSWIPTVLFAFGVFLVIIFTALPMIGVAGSARANAYKDRLRNEQEREKF